MGAAESHKVAVRNRRWARCVQRHPEVRRVELRWGCESRRLACRNDVVDPRDGYAQDKRVREGPGVVRLRWTCVDNGAGRVRRDDVHGLICSDVDAVDGHRVAVVVAPKIGMDLGRVGQAGNDEGGEQQECLQGGEEPHTEMGTHVWSVPQRPWAWRVGPGGSER